MKRIFRYGFEFSDCWVDDARLVVLNALDAAERGADIRTRTRLIRAERRRGMGPGAQCRAASGRPRRARVLVNAAGPWIGQVAETVLRTAAEDAGAADQGQPHRRAPALRHDCGYLLQAVDGRIRLRAALRRRLHADRHHRRDLRRRSRLADAVAERGDLSVRGRERVFPRPGDAGRTGLVVRRRALAL